MSALKHIEVDAGPLPTLAAMEQSDVIRHPVLLIDDDTELAGMLAELLSREGFDLAHAATGQAGLALLAQETPDVLVLDLMLPDTHGLDLCRQLRAQGQDLPVLMLSARGDPIDRVLGLEIGADDYLAKPFEPRELVARVRALSRRRRPAAASLRQFGPLTLDLLARRASWAGQTLGLTGAEFKLLAALSAQPGQTLSREQLSAAVQPGSYMPLDRAVDVQVARLRKKLRAAPGGVDCIDTVRGEGYVFIGRAT
jgi:DNA-binding response OmpR family regulator